MGRTMRYTIAPRVKTPVKEWYAPDAAEGSDSVTEYRSVATMESWVGGGGATRVSYGGPGEAEAGHAHPEEGIPGAGLNEQCKDAERARCWRSSRQHLFEQSAVRPARRWA